MHRLIVAALALSVAAFASAQTVTVTPSPIVLDATCDLYRGTSIVRRDVANTPAAIAEAMRADALGRRIDGNYTCRTSTPGFADYNAATPTCGPVSPPETRTQTCPAGTTGSWSQTRTYSNGTPPACNIAGPWLPASAPAGSCVPVTPPTGTVLHFAPSGVNSNAGTEASPKRDVSGTNLSTLPRGTVLRFQRGGEYAWSPVSLENMNATPEVPLIFEAYGEGAAPVLRVNTTDTALRLGGNWGNTAVDGGYVFRDIVFNGFRADGTFSQTGIWLMHSVQAVRLERVKVTGFWIGIYGTKLSENSVRDVTIIDSDVSENGSMGWLGASNNLRIERTLFARNNRNGDNRNHAIYLSDSRGVRILGNRFDRNSVNIDGPAGSTRGYCTGGNITVHGVVDDMAIEDNDFQQDRSTANCYGVSITSGYNDRVESFTNTAVRRNTFTNLGQCAVCVNSAPGVVVEDNRSFWQWTQAPSAWAQFVTIAPANGETDVPMPGATVRNNTGCLLGAPGGGLIAASWSPQATLEGNTVRTGADASTGPCAR